MFGDAKWPGEGIVVKQFSTGRMWVFCGVAPAMAHSSSRLRIDIHNTTEISFFQQKT
jgi:hypothetical protein